MYGDTSFGAFRVNSPLIPRQGVSEPAGGDMDSNEIDPTWGTPSSGTRPMTSIQVGRHRRSKPPGSRFGHLADIR